MIIQGPTEEFIGWGVSSELNRTDPYNDRKELLDPISAPENGEPFLACCVSQAAPTGRTNDRHRSSFSRLAWIGLLIRLRKWEVRIRLDDFQKFCWTT